MNPLPRTCIHRVISPGFDSFPALRCPDAQFKWMMLHPEDVASSGATAERWRYVQGKSFFKLLFSEVISNEQITSLRKLLSVVIIENKC